MTELSVSSEAKRVTIRLPSQATRHNMVNVVLGFAVFLGGFVIKEPAPYELFMVFLIGIWILSGRLTLSRTMTPLITLLLLFTASGFVSFTQVSLLNQNITIYMLVTAFLCATSIFVASLVSIDTERRLQAIQIGYILSALIVATVGCLAYFQLMPQSETFLRFGRAKGTFGDPNVYGPFLVLPAVMMIRNILVGSTNQRLISAAIFGFIAFAIFLSFSRAAMGLTVFCCGAMAALTFVQYRNPFVRLRLIVIILLALATISIALGYIISSGVLGELLTQRLHLVQEYDSARNGRFARHLQGFIDAFERPLGLGPLQFSKIYGEDPHNLYLKSIVAYGWTGFISMLMLILITVVTGLRQLLLDRPWTPFLQACFVTFLGHLLIGMLIDLDHWRHFYLLIGLLWGMFVANAKWREVHHLRSNAVPNGGNL